MTLRVAILISGGGSNMEALVRSMTPGHPARPALVLADRPEAPGLARARALGVPTAVVDRAAFPTREGFEAALLDALGAPDLLCLAGFLRILSPAVLRGREGRVLNVHPSLLPRHKGLRTHARALAAGDREHGCTVHEVTARLDDGPLLGQARLPILPGDTPLSLAARVLALEHRLYPAVLARVCEGDRTPLRL